MAERSGGYQIGWKGGRWSAFKSRCKADLTFDPNKDGDLVAAELLGKRKGPWEAVWERFAESLALFRVCPSCCASNAVADGLAFRSCPVASAERGSEASLRKPLLDLEKKTPGSAREQMLSLEKTHGIRRGWVWATTRRGSTTWRSTRVD